jgi:hypothetical protein
LGHFPNIGRASTAYPRVKRLNCDAVHNSA